MVTVLGIPGRFGELTITRSEVRALQATECGCAPSGLERVWDKIKDWFCNTKLVEAKQHLHVLYDPDASTNRKAESYFALKSLVGPAYLDRFSEKSEDFGFSLNIHFGEKLEPFSEIVTICSRSYLEEKLDEDITRIAADPLLAESSERELARDLPRSVFTIAGERIVDLDPDVIGEPGKIENLRAAITDALNVTEEQMLVLEWLSYQKTFAFVMESAFQKNGGRFRPDDVLHIRGDGDVAIDFAGRGNDVELHLNFQASWLDLGTERSILMRDPVYDIRLAVGPEGTLSVVGAVLGFNPNRAGLPLTNV